MASTQNGGSSNGASAPDSPQNDNGSESDTIHVAAASTGQTQGQDATTQAPTTSTATMYPPTHAAPVPTPSTQMSPASDRQQANQRGLRGAPWLPEEDFYVFTLLAEEPDMPWREITPRLNAQFPDQPDRTSEAVRLRFRLQRGPFQARLNAQNGVGDHLADESEDEDGDEGEDGDEQEVQDLAQILLEVVDGVKSQEEDSDDDDEDPENDNDLPGGGG
ncbi:hypothetical protein PRZ48_004918 [Zasmidium cellare]|uniref:Myb-like domain-containing protein n=1 Tax=Zasmidium cellare TaxID=395010 RepID=A0ABR0ES24_ZASCE|nr:hypothetical protein PRZ48_004918 [Zasmidium cellare]